MDEDRNKEPRERLRNILAGDDDEETSLQPEPQPEPPPSVELNEHRQPPAEPAESPLAKLPRMKQPAQEPPPADAKASLQISKPPVSPVSLDNLPKSKPAKNPEKASEEKTKATIVTTQVTQSMPRREKFLRALWTITSVISMTVNIVVVIILLLALWLFRGYKIPEGIDLMVLNNLLSGLYSNFEKMDRASIQTVIPVDAQIPLDISVPVQTTTQITLAETVVIPNAQVVINTGGLNINSNARVTLPAGTPLNVNLNFELPVQTSIPVHLDVPVNIPMANTELHEPFVGLQNVVRPLYCLVDPNATSLDEQLICR